MVTRIAIFNWFIHNTPIEDTIKNHNNILDFCIGLRARDSKFIEITKDIKINTLPKTIRYFISNRGNVFKKQYNDGSVEYLNVHPQKGRTFYQTLLNEYDDTLAKNYDINYSYYIWKTRTELSIFTEKANLF